MAYDQFWQSLEEGAGKRCSECGKSSVSVANRVCASDVVVTSYPLASSTHRVDEEGEVRCLEAGTQTFVAGRRSDSRTPRSS